MTIATTIPLPPVESQRVRSFRLCRPWLVFTLVILVAIQAILATGAWVYPHARLLMPDVYRTEGGEFAFPPQLAEAR